jgi:proteasome lid subunit RPN8/RPN11
MSRTLSVPTNLVEEMRSHARATYPDECCGYLIGPDREGGDVRTILEVRRGTNSFGGEQRRRFVLSPDELRLLERELDGTGRAVVGFYHSHPDHPARPSEFDRDHAWPWYSYVVLSVTADGVPAWGAFELDGESRSFDSVGVRGGTEPIGSGIPRA